MTRFSTLAALIVSASFAAPAMAAPTRARVVHVEADTADLEIGGMLVRAKIAGTTQLVAGTETHVDISRGANREWIATPFVQEVVARN